jgi:type VI secretion system secreted protein Hcp
MTTKINGLQTVSEDLAQLAASDPQRYAALIFQGLETANDSFEAAPEAYGSSSDTKSVNLFLKLNGQPVDGEPKQTTLGRAKSIECFYYQQDVTVARETGTGQASGRRTYGPIVIRKPIDKSSPLLFKGLTENQVTEGIFKFYRSASDSSGVIENFYTVGFKQGRIGMVKQVIPEVQTRAGTSAAEHEPYEEVSFFFREISWTYTKGGVTHEDAWGRT